MADKLSFDLEYCYGIPQFSEELEFTHKGYAIYAPNGVMKTSLTKTLLDVQNGNEPKDLAFPDRDSKCIITLNGDALKGEEVLVVRSYDETYSSGEVSTLLANSELKAKYEAVHKKIGDAKKNLDKKLRKLSGFGVRENIDPIIEGLFSKNYYEALLSVEGELNSLYKSGFSDAIYKVIFDPKVVNLLQEQGVETSVEEFAEKYDSLTEQSPILRQEFQYHNISQVQQQLKTNNFFDAGHSINLTDKGTDEKIEYGTDDELNEKITSEKLRILGDEELNKRFDNFNKKFKNKELQEFRDYITQNRHLLIELKDLSQFKRKLWLQYFLAAKKEFDELISEYKVGQLELTDIIRSAEADVNDWDAVITQFNQRFLHLPFKLKVANKSDVILKDLAPSINFVFEDNGEERVYKSTERSELIRVLSTGEARALYILNIMFEVHTRWKFRTKTLFVFDDIADSFDYKNKFAIIDYLEFIISAEDVSFLVIVLTHNFDFLRVIESRGICKTSQCRMAFRNENKVELEVFKRSDIGNPFNKWKTRLGEIIILVAYIPFLRNVIEYTKGKKNGDGSHNEDYQSLTNMLHFKDDVEALTVGDYRSVFERTLPDTTFPIRDNSETVIDLILDAADECLGKPDGINLEQKIVLSMAIRLKADKFTIEKIRSEDAEYVLPSSNQTPKLIRDYCKLFNNQHDEIAILRRVSLLTPSNIHLNAFMYEPILDMGYGELKQLYQDATNKLT
ncbi:hypothetical protein [Yoonia sp. I 8.24]|uniref:hypothetical protein n=1 Tax=Yoonia sp. I 8.24 TaxID=1537229 RepID=UPI001EE0F8BF|nr:hypothetical protein [Yoonia sp. I 8.24]MCG3266278.1 hypothetical protein [Yoonia sp. I 8.24]